MTQWQAYSIRFKQSELSLLRSRAKQEHIAIAEVIRRALAGHVYMKDAEVTVTGAPLLRLMLIIGGFPSLSTHGGQTLNLPESTTY